jgi:hypothetical protein
MKKVILGLLAAATVGVTVAPVAASAQGVVIRENRRGDVVVRPAGVYVDRGYYGRDRGYGYGYRHHYGHRVVWFDRWGHRHIDWR